MRAAAVQMNSGADKARNVAAADRLTRAAAAGGADLVVLPEKFNVLGTDEDYAREAETLEGPTVAWARDVARELQIELVAGSIVERREGHERVSNTSVHISPDGQVRAAYRKIHMFDVVVEGVEYSESAACEPGDEIVVSETAEGTTLGLSVCYDIRFPELYRILAVRGARIITVPAAFTVPTGRAHWELLLRARAVENQSFVVAADQFGPHPGGKESYGGSLVADPSGRVLARADEGEGFAIADLDLDAQDDLRDRFPALRNRVPEAYRWPVEAGV